MRMVEPGHYVCVVTQKETESKWWSLDPYLTGLNWNLLGPSSSDLVCRKKGTG